MAVRRLAPADIQPKELCLLEGQSRLGEERDHANIRRAGRHPR